MNSREFSEPADFFGGMAKNTRSANDRVAASRRVHENALFFHSPNYSLEQFECSTQFKGQRVSDPAGRFKSSLEASLRLKLFDAFEKNVTNDGQCFGTDFVERILRGVPVVDVAAGTVIEIDDIHRGNVAL